MRYQIFTSVCQPSEKDFPCSFAHLMTTNGDAMRLEIRDVCRIKRQYSVQLIAERNTDSERKLGFLLDRVNRQILGERTIRTAAFRQISIIMNDIYNRRYSGPTIGINMLFADFLIEAGALHDF